MSTLYLILGGAGGIGSTLARQLASRGAHVAVAGRTQASLNALAEEIEGEAQVVDVTSAEDDQRLVDFIVATHGPLTGLANCVGSILLKPAHRTSSEEWGHTFSTNLDCAFATVRAGTASMLKTGGSIALLSSAAARLGLANHEAIAAAKAGVVGLAISAAASHVRRGIRVKVVSPGLVRTPLSESITKSPAAEKASIGMHALGRLGEPEDVARALVWLLAPEQSWVTGQVIGVDGGLGSVRAQ